MSILFDLYKIALKASIEINLEKEKALMAKGEEIDMQFIFKNSILVAEDKALDFYKSYQEFEQRLVDKKII